MSYPSNVRKIRTSVGRVWDSRRNGTYIRAKHGPLTQKDKANYEQAKQEVINMIAKGEISDKKY